MPKIRNSLNTEWDRQEKITKPKSSILIKITKSKIQWHATQNSQAWKSYWEDRKDHFEPKWLWGVNRHTWAPKHGGVLSLKIIISRRGTVKLLRECKPKWKSKTLSNNWEDGSCLKWLDRKSKTGFERAETIKLNVNYISKEMPRSIFRDIVSIHKSMYFPKKETSTTTERCTIFSCSCSQRSNVNIWAVILDT